MDEGVVATSWGRVHYVRSGNGPAVVLLHGNGQSAHVWRHCVESLAHDADVVAWDMPGQGDSGPMTRHLSIDEYADAADELATSLGLDRPVYVGSSVGGQICASLATRHADAVGGVVFVETNLRSQRWWSEHWLEMERLFTHPSEPRESMAARVRDATPEAWERWVIDRNKAGVASMMSVMWAIREYDLAAALGQIRTAARVVFGASGPAIGAADDFAAALPGAPIDVLQKSGHFPMLDEPDRFTAVLRAFLHDVAAPQRADDRVG